MADGPLVFSMRELNQQTARVMGEIERTGQPAFITRHGRYVFVIKQIDPREAQSRVLLELAQEA